MTLRRQPFWPIRFEQKLARSWRCKHLLETYEEKSRHHTVLTWRVLKECI